AVLRRARRDRSRRARAAHRRPALAGPGPPHLEARRRGEGERLARQDHQRAHRLVHELVLRGHAARRAHRDAGDQGGAQGEDPVHGTLPGPDGRPFRFTAPEAEELPRDGFARGEEGFEAPADDPDSVQVIVKPDSDRLQLLAPFPRWDGRDFVDLPILVKTKGKTTTDHISPAGPWLRYRGHLDKISDNMFLGAVNAFTGEAGKGVNP